MHLPPVEPRGTQEVVLQGVQARSGTGRLVTGRRGIKVVRLVGGGVRHLQCAALGEPGGVGSSWSVSEPRGKTGEGSVRRRREMEDRAYLCPGSGAHSVAAPCYDATPWGRGRASRGAPGRARGAPPSRRGRSRRAAGDGC